MRSGEGCHGYDSQKYAAMLREALDPFERLTGTHVNFLIRSIQHR